MPIPGNDEWPWIGSGRLSRRPGRFAFGQRVRAGGPSLGLLYGTGAGDRLGRLNDLLIGLTAREIGATVVTRNHEEFARIATVVPGLAVTAP